MSCTVSGVLSQSIKNPATNQTYLKENFFISYIHFSTVYKKSVAIQTNHAI